VIPVLGTASNSVRPLAELTTLPSDLFVTSLIAPKRFGDPASGWDLLAAIEQNARWLEWELWREQVRREKFLLRIPAVVRGLTTLLSQLGGRRHHDDTSWTTVLKAWRLRRCSGRQSPGHLVAAHPWLTRGPNTDADSHISICPAARI
jgi:hypothetical protein